MQVATKPVAIMHSSVPIPNALPATQSLDIVEAAPRTPFQWTDEFNKVADATDAAQQLSLKSGTNQAHGVYETSTEHDYALAIAPLNVVRAEDGTRSPLSFDSPTGPNVGNQLRFEGKDPSLVAIVGASMIADLHGGELYPLARTGRLA